MKKIIFVFLAIVIYQFASAQFVAKMEVREYIPGLCDSTNVYALFEGFKGQAPPICPVSKDEIQKRLNEIQFLKDNPKYKDKGMMGLIINCKGKVVRCQMDNKTKSPELDKQIEAVFNSLGQQWVAGKLNGASMDASVLYGFTIKKGVLSLE